MLVTANYHLLLKKTSMSMASGVEDIEPLWQALGKERAMALSAIHAFTGVDNTGRFSRIGKSTWLQVYLKTDEEVINALPMLLDVKAEGMLSQSPLYVQLTHPRVSTSRKSPNCNGSCSASTEQKVTSSLQHMRVQIRAWAVASIAQQHPQLDPLQNGYYTANGWIAETNDHRGPPSPKGHP